MHGGRGVEKMLKGWGRLACGGLSESVCGCGGGDALDALGGGGGSGRRREVGARIVSATRWNCCRRMLAGCNVILGVGVKLDRGDGL